MFLTYVFTMFLTLINISFTVFFNAFEKLVHFSGKNEWWPTTRPIWEFFSERQDLGEKRAECITCKKVMVGNAKRMRQDFGNHGPDLEQSPRAPKLPRITNFTVSTSKADQRIMSGTNTQDMSHPHGSDWLVIYWRQSIAI